MPKVSQAHKDARRAQVVEAALVCFRDRGVAATSMRDILAECGLSAGAVYAYFPSKDDLIVFLAAEAVTRWQDAFNQLAEQADDVPGARLLALVDDMLQALEDPVAVSEIGADLDIWTLAIHHPQLRPQCMAVFRTIAEGFSALLVHPGQGQNIALQENLGWTLLAHFQGLGLQAALGRAIDIEHQRAALRALIEPAL